MKSIYFLAIPFLLLFVACQKDTSMPEVLNPEPELIDVCGQSISEKVHPKQEVFQNILDKYVAKGFPGISALIYTPEDGVWQGTAGYSNVEEQIDMLTCNVLYSGSVAKMYTVSAAMSLYEEGILDLDEKISNYLSQRLIDSLPNAQIATIRQLMNHTAGIPDQDDEADLDDYILSNNGNLPSAENQLAYLFDNFPNFEAGMAATYSSAHTLTLSLVLDSLLQKHHATAITEKIINKLGLEQTYYKNESGYPSPDKLINGYVKMDGVQQNISELSINLCLGSQGDAGIIASAHDYYLFLKGLMEGQIVNPTTLDLMQQPEWFFDNGDTGFGFGLGLFLLKQNGAIFKIGHSGTTAGGMSHVYYYPEKRAYMVLLTNILGLDQATNTLWGQNLIAQPGQEAITNDFEQLVLNN